MPDQPMDRVVPLNSLDGWKVADGEPDIRGWEVVSAEGRRIGKVDELLVDTTANKVRYVDVDLTDDERHVTIPVGYARLDRDDKRVTMDRIGSEQLQALPAYTHGPITRDYEEQVSRAMGGNRTEAQGASANRDFYDRDEFRDDEMRMTLSEEQLAVGKRDVNRGEVDIHKRVETEHVERDVPLRREDVEIERRPIREGMHAGDRPEITEDEVRIPLHAEEAVVEKRVVPKEELVVRKRETVEHETVEADLRKERADVDRDVDVNRDDRGGLR
jgi:uncharacterized protein (TIGR02271 family)